MNGPANAECVGPTSQTAGKESSCDGCPNQSNCASGAYNNPEAIAKAQMEQEQLYHSLRHVSHIILILSGKGGVGKSTLATQLALTLSYQNYAVGLLDIDLCGPSIPQMIFGKSKNNNEQQQQQQQPQQTIHQNGQGLWIPVYTTPTNLAVMSINFLLSGNTDQAVIWRGPRKNALIQQFLTQVDWSGITGDGLDYLIIDTPPGTSDEHISTVQYIQQAISEATTTAVKSSNTDQLTTTTITPTTTTTTTLGAIVITTPEEASLADVRKELSFCLKTKLNVYGIIENMATMEITSMDQFHFYDKSTGENCTSMIHDKIKQHCPELFNHQYIISSDLFSTSSSFKKLNDDDTDEISKNYSNSVVAEMAITYQYPYWGTIPMDRTLLQYCEDGNTNKSNQKSSLCFALQYPTHTAAKAIIQFCTRIIEICPVDMIEEEMES